MEVAAVRRLLTVALVVVVAVLVIGVEGAQAAFPGANGRIAFTVAKWRVAPGQHPGYAELVWSRIETVLASGAGLRELRACPAGGCFDSDPAWSPSGRLLAFQQGSATGSRLAIVRQDGKRLRQITTGSAAQPAGPAWSPDGRRLVFVGAPLPMGIPQLFTVASNGTGLRRITGLCADEPAWSVKGTIAFRAACQTTGIYTIRPDGSRLRRLIYNRYWPPTFPAWSPYGSKLTYTGAVSDAGSDIYISNATGGGVRCRGAECGG